MAQRHHSRNFARFLPHTSACSRPGGGGLELEASRAETLWVETPQHTKKVIDGQFAKLKPTTASHFGNLRAECQRQLSHFDRTIRT